MLLNTKRLLVTSWRTQWSIKQIKHQIFPLKVGRDQKPELKESKLDLCSLDGEEHRLGCILKGENISVFYSQQDGANVKAIQIYVAYCR